MPWVISVQYLPMTTEMIDTLVTSSNFLDSFNSVHKFGKKQYIKKYCKPMLRILKQEVKLILGLR